MKFFTLVVLLVSVSHSGQIRMALIHLEDTIASCAARMCFARARSTIKILNDIANDEKQPFLFRQLIPVRLFLSSLQIDGREKKEKKW